MSKPLDARGPKMSDGIGKFDHQSIPLTDIAGILRGLADVIEGRARTLADIQRDLKKPRK